MRILIVSFLLATLLCLTASADAQISFNDFVALASKDKEYILAPPPKRAFDLFPFEEDVWRRASATIADFYKNPSLEELGGFMLALSDIARIKSMSIVSDDKIIGNLFLSALTININEIKNDDGGVFGAMTRTFSKTFLCNNSTALLSFLESRQYSSLWSCCYYNEEQKIKYQYLLKKDSIKLADILLNAKLGDVSARDKLINQLSTAEEKYQKLAIIDALGYLGDRDSIIALLKEFSDNKVYGGDKFGYTTCRPATYVAIWRNFPQDQIWVENTSLIISFADRPGKKDKILQFYREVEKWASSKFGVEIDLKNAEPFMGQSGKIVVHMPQRGFL